MLGEVGDAAEQAEAVEVEAAVGADVDVFLE